MLRTRLAVCAAFSACFALALVCSASFAPGGWSGMESLPEVQSPAGAAAANLGGALDQTRVTSVAQGR